MAYPEKNDVMSKTKVYYNSACPVCNAGIKYQQRKADRESEIEWIDVHRRNEAASEVHADLEFVRERLHVMDEIGNVHVGSEAFAELWSKTPGQQLLGRLARTPALRALFRWVYNGFAAGLYQWNRLKKRW